MLNVLHQINFHVDVQEHKAIENKENLNETQIQDNNIINNIILLKVLYGEEEIVYWVESKYEVEHILCVHVVVFIDQE